MERVFSPAVSRRTLLQGTAAAGSSLLLPHGAFAQDKPQRGGTLRVSMTYNPAALDPMTGRNGPDFNTLLALFDALLDVDPKTLEVKPMLATKWTWPDNKTLVMDLRTDVVFHDDTAFDAEAAKSLAKPFAKRGTADQRILFKAMTGTADSIFNPLYDRHLELDNIFKNGTTTLVMKELPQPRKTTLFIKGDFTRPSDEVLPGVLAVLPPLPAGAKADRLALARWLIDPKNPLTARVVVNRVWQQYFGRGLVETENDFGTMGRLPSHPELLDWLAVDFMEHHWSLKHLHQLIVTSATYQQSSSMAGGLKAERQTDPNNYLLWRQNRLRLDAEVVRDVCLATSGLLSSKMGGAPVYPPIPEGVMSLGQVKRAWPLSKGSDCYRRGIYTFIFRATPPPALSVFDAPDGFSTCTRRIRSNTPLQALTLLNDSAYVEFAQALAARLIKEAKTDDARITHAYQLCLSRPPLDRERQALFRLLDAERKAGSAEPQAWQAVARVMLNLDETITRE